MRPHHVATCSQRLPVCVWGEGTLYTHGVDKMLQTPAYGIYYSMPALRACAEFYGSHTRRCLITPDAEGPSNTRPARAPPQRVNHAKTRTETRNCPFLVLAGVSGINKPWNAPVPCHFTGIICDYQDLGLQAESWRIPVSGAWVNTNASCACTPTYTFSRIAEPLV